MLIAEGHWFKRKDRFACFVHRLDRVFETRRACGRAKMTTGVHDNCYTCWNSCTANPGDDCRRLRSLPANTNGVGFASDTSIENVDIVATGREVEAGITA